MPDTANDGLTAFNRYFYAQIGKQAAIVDERFNGGGLLATDIAEILSRKRRLHRCVYRRHPRLALESPNQLVLRWKGTSTDMEKGFARTNVRNRRI